MHTIMCVYVSIYKKKVLNIKHRAYTYMYLYQQRITTVIF